jgi:hypothetical protein
METPQKKNKKWVFFAGIVAVLALAVAIGPILVAKHMRAKYAKTVRIKTSNMMIKVKGTIEISGDTVYLKGDNAKIYLLLGDQLNEIKKNVGETATIFGDMAHSEIPTINGEQVRLAIYVTKFGLPDLPSFSGSLSDAESERLRQRADEKLEYRDSILTRLKKMDDVRLEVAGGVITHQTREVSEDLKRQYSILTDKWGDKYVLLVANGSFTFPDDGAEYIALGKVAIPSKNYPIKKDEVMFVVEGFYKADNLEKLF